MPVPKKRTSISKKKIRKNFWKKKGYKTALKAFSLGKSIFTGNSKSFSLAHTGNSKIFSLAQSRAQSRFTGNSKGFGN